MQNHRRNAGLTAASLALLLAAGANAQTAPAAPSAEPAMASQAPVPLFKAVCLDGTAKLSRKWASATTYPALPRSAKSALGHGDADVPNPVFQIGATSEYLIVPAADTAAGSSFAAGCAVVWKGNDLAEAGKMIALAPADIAVTATGGLGWTVLKALPRPGAAAPAPAAVR